MDTFTTCPCIHLQSSCLSVKELTAEEIKIEATKDTGVSQEQQAAFSMSPKYACIDGMHRAYAIAELIAEGTLTPENAKVIPYLLMDPITPETPLLVTNLPTNALIVCVQIRAIIYKANMPEHLMVTIGLSKFAFPRYY